LRDNTEIWILRDNTEICVIRANIGDRRLMPPRKDVDDYRDLCSGDDPEIYVLPIS